jgi:hypothetical protein
MTIEPHFSDTFEEIPLPAARVASCMKAAVVGDLDVPDRTAFLAADDADFGALFAVVAFDEGRPVLVVMPDGVEFLYEPRTGVVSRLSRWWKARFASRGLRSMGPLVADDSQWTDLDIGNAGLRHRVHGRRPVTAA